MKRYILYYGSYESLKDGPAPSGESFGSIKAAWDYIEQWASEQAGEESLETFWQFHWAHIHDTVEDTRMGYRYFLRMLR